MVRWLSWMDEINQKEKQISKYSGQFISAYFNIRNLRLFKLMLFVITKVLIGVSVLLDIIESFKMRAEG